MEDRKKLLFWITPDCFMDTDFLIVPQLNSHFYIHWIILQSNKCRFSRKNVDCVVSDCKNIQVEYVNDRYRQRNPLRLFIIIKILCKIRSLNPDAVYLNLSTDLWDLFMIPILRSKNTVVTAHQGRAHLGMAHKKMVTVIRKIWYEHFKNVNMFSRSQAELFKLDFPNSKIFQFVLGLKDFGPANNQRPMTGDIRFLSFGTLNYAKSIETLIDAACLLYERGVRGFIVSINGMCKDWSWYQQRIKYPEIFELNIRMIDNSEIPNLFNGAHYLVQPYRVVSQSGPTKIAFNYNVPVIVSNLPGFMDELKEGVNGYSFECGNVKSLADKMQFLIMAHHVHYQELLNKMSEYTRKNYSMDSLITRYSRMFTEVINKCQ